MIERLYDLSLKIVADRMKDGILGDDPHKLTLKISDDIYRIISRQHWCKFPDTFSKEAIKWLNPTSISITQSKMQEGEWEMFKSMDHLVHLWTDQLSKTSFQKTTIKIQNGSSIELQLNYVEILEQMLSEPSRESLKSLRFEGEGVTTIQGWPYKLSKLLPSLEHLAIHHDVIDKDTFNLMCASFECLKSLDFTGTEIQNMNSISMLQNLQHLCLSDVRFPTLFTPIDGMFELKQLRSLDVHSNLLSNRDREYSTIMNRFFDCAKVLPNLMVLDCSSNVFYATSLSRLLASHPTLQQIDVTDTEASDVKSMHPEVLKDFPHVKVFTTESLNSCLKCLKNHSRENKRRQFRVVLCRIHEILQDEASVYSNTDMHDCFQQIVQIMGRWHHDDIIAAAVGRCMLTMCRLPNFSQFFTFSEKQSLIGALFKIRYAPENMGCQDKTIAQILNIDSILATSPENIDSICDYAIELMRSGDRETNQHCLEVLSKSVDKMKPERRALAAEDFERAIMETLAADNIQFDTDLHLQVYRLLKKMTDREFIEFLMKFCNQLFKESVQVATLNRMKTMVNGLDEDIRKSFFGERYFSIIENCLKDRECPNTQKAAIALLVELYCLTEPGIDADTKQFLIEIVHKYMLEFVEDGLDFFEAMVKAKKYANFTSWVLAHFSEEPKGKRRRLC